MLCHSTGRGNRQSAESLYRSRGPQSWSHPGGLETAHSRPAFPCVKHIRYRRTHNSSSFPSVPHNDKSGCSRETQIADCRLRNVTAASSHGVLTGNRTAFQFFVSQLSPFLVPPPHTRHQHFTPDTFITSGSFFSRGNKLPAPAAASTGKSSGNRRRETQTVKIVSDERSAPRPAFLP